MSVLRSLGKKGRCRQCGASFRIERPEEEDALALDMALRPDDTIMGWLKTSVEALREGLHQDGRTSEMQVELAQDEPADPERILPT